MLTFLPFYIFISNLILFDHSADLRGSRKFLYYLFEAIVLFGFLNAIGRAQFVCLCYFLLFCSHDLWIIPMFLMSLYRANYNSLLFFSACNAMVHPFEFMWHFSFVALK